MDYVQILLSRLKEGVDTFKAAVAKREAAIAPITQQILDQWKQIGATNIPGGLSIEQRARGLAERLYVNRITD